MNLTIKIIFIFISSLILLSCGTKKTTPSKNTKTIDNTATVDSSTRTDSTSTIRTLSYEERQGKNVYDKYCAVCHGVNGAGDGFNSFNLDPKPRDFTDTKLMSTLNDEYLTTIIKEGGRGTNKSAAMPPWGGRLSKMEIEYVVSYVHAFGISK